MEQLKEAFFKVKQDIDFLKKEILILNEELIETRKSLIEVCEILKNSIPAHNPLIPAHSSTIPTDNSPEKALNNQNLGISTGNGGVPTDKQTDKQTDKKEPEGSHNNSISNALYLLESLDTLKKELRLKFKRLTEQEVLVFSVLYQSSDEKGYTDYRTLSEKLNLTESSIRDYIGRLIKKGIPIEKVKINNKAIQLSISPNLKKIASLDTILHLRSI